TPGASTLASNYALPSTASGAGHITPADATWTTNSNGKTYGDPDPNPLTTGSGSGFVAADGVTATYTRTAGETVGDGPYHITATLAPAAALSNYSITDNGADFTINKRLVTVTADTKSKTYGDPDPALTYQITSGSLAFSDAFTGALTRAAGESVGTFAIQQGSVALSSNYVLTYVGANLTINKRLVTVTPAAASKTYGDTDPAFTGTLTNFVAADGVTATYSRTAGETVAGSPYTISAALNPAGVLGNYSITYNTASFPISKRAVSVTPNAAGKTYG